MPGLVETFLGPAPGKDYSVFGPRNVRKYYGSEVLVQLNKHNIHLGILYGTSGIELSDFLLLDSVPPGVLFEMCAVTYSHLPAPIKKQLKKYKDCIILQDHMQVLYTQSKVNHKTASGTAEGVPMWLLCTMADAFETNNISTQFPHSDTPGLAICLVNKMRKHRLDMLEQLHQSNLLDQVDWTCSVTLPPDDTVAYLRLLKHKAHPFVARYKDQLPKNMHIDTYKECVTFPQRMHGNYKWMICCETYDNVPFATEKTFKAFLSGAIPLTVACKGFNQHLLDMGFLMPGDYDHFSGKRRAKRIAEILQTDNTDYTEIAKHNYERIMDVRGISTIIAQRIKEQYTL